MQCVGVSLIGQNHKAFLKRRRAFLKRRRAVLEHIALELRSDGLEMRSDALEMRCVLGHRIPQLRVGSPGEKTNEFGIRSVVSTYFG